MGDFNGDGIPDLVTVGYRSMSVLLGNGDGSFRPAHTLATDALSYSVAVGDFNGDGIQDLAVANYGASSGSVSILLGNGDGTFQPPRNFSSGAESDFVAVGDVNGDGIPDLVVANENAGGSGGVSVLLGNGDGSFQPAHSVAAGTRPYALALADINGDGIPDLALTAYYGDGLGYLKVLLGNGDGSFHALGTVSGGPISGSIALGDFNGDGIPDAAVSDNDGTIRVLPGNGNGVFHNSVAVFQGGAGPIVVGDFNGDGFPDLAVGAGGGEHLAGQRRRHLSDSFHPLHRDIHRVVSGGGGCQRRRSTRSGGGRSEHQRRDSPPQRWPLAFQPCWRAAAPGTSPTRENSRTGHTACRGYPSQ